ncbi:ATP-binding protein [Halovenus marina]|uniref:ATP-binding protein n=1 Tax=Halovenus marina TaxID=3396621 RepID=UPI003F5702AB
MSKNNAYASAELASHLRDDPGEHVRPYAGLIDDPDTLGLLAHLDTVLTEPVEQTQIGREIIANAATDTLDESVRAGNVSQMKAATGLTNQSENKDRFFVEVADKLSHEGSIGLVFGSPGSGKTSVVLDAAQVWRAITGGKVIANIDWEGADRQFYSDQEMLEAMASYQGPVLAVLDEIAQELSGFGTGSKKAEAFTDQLLYIRKRESQHGEYAKRGSVMCVAHTRTKTAKDIRRVASFAVEKPDKTRPDRARILESEGGKDEWQEKATYQGLTETAERYDEYQASEFEVTQDYDSDDSDGADSGMSAEKRASIQTALTLALEQDMTYAEAGEAVGWSDSWVGNRVKEYRNGELDWVEIDE